MKKIPDLRAVSYENGRKIVIIDSTCEYSMGVIIMSQDTNEKKLEQLCRALADAQHANQEKNRLLERMSHEVRTPLNSIIGLSYLTKEYADDKKQVLENMEKITMSAHFLLSFMDDILNLSKIECGSIALNQGNTEFGAFLEELHRMTAERAEKKNISVSLETCGSFDRMYYFDREKLGRALYNILENAVKFTMPEGTVTFRAELISEMTEAAVIRFSVTDNGIGMEECFLPDMFEPFEQEDGGGTTLSGGTGLGLAIARNIIDFMDGHIEVSSVKGSGSVFSVTVSVGKVADEKACACAQSDPGALAYDFTGRRALLVEDNEINIEITRNILTHRNFAVEVAVNGEEGAAMFLAHAPGYYDVILMDIRMPVMDGLTAADKIRKSGREDGRKIPIVAMTANAFEEDVRKSFAAGMNAHLSKPVDIMRMYAVLDEMLRG